MVDRYGRTASFRLLGNHCAGLRFADTAGVLVVALGLVEGRVALRV